MRLCKVHVCGDVRAAARVDRWRRTRLLDRGGACSASIRADCRASQRSAARAALLELPSPMRSGSGHLPCHALPEQRKTN